jgi:Ca2+-binding EF-hand superfamily protein
MIMKRAILTGGALVVAFAAPLLAQRVGQSRSAGEQAGWMSQPQTRSDAEAKVKAHFAKLDTNGDGMVTQSEADGARRAMRAEMRNKHFETMDANKDGSISRTEFDAGHQDGARGKSDRRSDQGDSSHRRGQGKMGGGRLARADANDDGKVTLAEMTAATLARFDNADTDKNGTVTPDERRAARLMRRDRRDNRP